MSDGVEARYRLRSLPEYGRVSAWKPTFSGSVLRTVLDDDGVREFWDGDHRVRPSGDAVRARQWDRIGDSYLFCHGRASGGEWSPARPEAWIVDAEGAVEAELNFGDWVRTVAVDVDRNIWVGYQDQANPWSFPPGADATGRSGVEYWHPALVRWDECGTFHWVFAVDGVMAATCYTVNSGPYGVVAVTDADEPVVRVGVEGLIAGFGGDLVGPSAVAFDGRVATVLGDFVIPKRRGESGYLDDVLTRIDMETGEVVETGRVVMPDGSPLPLGKGVIPYRMAFGRGNIIGMVIGDPGVAHVLEL